MHCIVLNHIRSCNTCPCKWHVSSRLPESHNISMSKIMSGVRITICTQVFWVINSGGSTVFCYSNVKPWPLEYLSNHERRMCTRAEPSHIGFKISVSYTPVPWRTAGLENWRAAFMTWSGLPTNPAESPLSWVERDVDLNLPHSSYLENSFDIFWRSCSASISSCLASEKAECEWRILGLQGNQGVEWGGKEERK